MCGRFALAFITPEKLQKHFVLDHAEQVSDHYNIAPSQKIPVIREVDHQRFLSLLHWGLIPHWSKDATIGRKMINARCETVADKPSFRDSIRFRRCIVPASGFYEWSATSQGKIPYYLTSPDSAPFAFAGIWDSWQSPEGELIESCAILTTAPNPLMAKIHERMPVILHPHEFNHWLDPTVIDPRDLLKHYQPYPADLMQAWPVSSLVNSPHNDSPDCLTPVTHEATSSH